MLKRMTDIAAMAMLAMAAGGGLVGAQAQTPAQTDELTVRSRAVAADFQDKLRGQLMAALKTGGPLLALDVCQKAAPAIAEEVGARAGAKVWRTSLKARNPRGTPDAWERSVLEAVRCAAGRRRRPRHDRGLRAHPDRVPLHEGDSDGGALCAVPRRHYRARGGREDRRPLPAGPATGFAPGTLRGAVSITWPAAR